MSRILEGNVSSRRSGAPLNSKVVGICRYSMCFKRGPDACRIYLKKAGPFGLGEVPQETQTRTDALDEIDQQCFDRMQVSRTSVSKAFIAIDHTKFCGNTFQDEYRTGTFHPYYASHSNTEPLNEFNFRRTGVTIRTSYHPHREQRSQRHQLRFAALRSCP